ncbi:carbohydrate ABC transporter permease [Atribacter laminatus]|jgi:multiple sugar transport system permease protein|uniref:Trehalose transport system permease protein SugA n=1 Tax=Atribacter laminatus TaxID=2847778 RepID=A0A7T1AN68_ATRLM|nr:sugar ABC transporter permease [Atribacter laminatus]QPM68983.1 Trehalose transport system permease protein SugA [Atribacter laminatus]
MAFSIKTQKKLFPYLLLLPTLILLICIVIYPLIYSVNLSFHSYDLKKFTQGMQFVGFQNFLDAIKDTQFLKALKVTFLFMLIAIPAEFILGLAIALLLNKDVRGSKTIRTLVVIPMMVTPIIVGLQWRFLFNFDMGLINQILRLLQISPGINILGNYKYALFGVAIADIWQWTPFVILLCYSGLRSLPVEPFEAITIDGATSWQTFKYLTLPLLKPIIVITVLLRTMDAFRIYDMIYTLTFGGPGSSTETASFYVYRVSFKLFQMGYGAALSYILLIITIIIANLFVKSLKQVWEGQ